MSELVDIQSQLLHYVKAMKKPLLFVAKNEYANVGAIRDLGPTLVTVLDKAQELPFSESQKALLANLKESFREYEAQSVDDRATCVAAGLQSLRELERMLSVPPVSRPESVSSPTASPARSAPRPAQPKQEDRSAPPRDKNPAPRKEESRPRSDASDERRKPEGPEATREESPRRGEKAQNIRPGAARDARTQAAPAARTTQRAEQRPAERVFLASPYRERSDQDSAWGRVRREAAPDLEPLLFLPLPPDEEDEAQEQPEQPSVPKEAAPRPPKGREGQRTRPGRPSSESSADRSNSDRQRPGSARPMTTSSAERSGEAQRGAPSRGTQNIRGRAGSQRPVRTGGHRSPPKLLQSYPLPPDLVEFEPFIEEFVPANAWSRFGLPASLAQALSDSSPAEDSSTEDSFEAVTENEEISAQSANADESDTVMPEGDDLLSPSDDDVVLDEDDSFTEDTLAADSDVDDREDDDAQTSGDDQTPTDDLLDDLVEESSGMDPEMLYGTPSTRARESSDLVLDVEPPDLDELRNFDSIPAAEDIPPDDSSLSNELAEDAGGPSGSDELTPDEFEAAETSVSIRVSDRLDAESRPELPSIQEQGAHRDEQASAEDESYLNDLSDDLTIHEVMAEVVERAAWGGHDTEGSLDEPELETPLTFHAEAPELEPEPSDEPLVQPDDEMLEAVPAEAYARESFEEEPGEARGVTQTSAEDEVDELSMTPTEGDASQDGELQNGDAEEDDSDLSDAGASELLGDDSRRRGRRRRRRRKGSAGETEPIAATPSTPTKESAAPHLGTSLADLPVVGPRLGAILEQQGLKKIQDLLYFFPRDWVDRRLMHAIRELTPGTNAVFQATIDPAEVQYSEQGRILEVRLTDLTGSILARWPNVRSNYLRNRFRQGAVAIVSGLVEELEGEAVLVNPEVELLGSEEDDGVSTGRIVPLYPPLEGLGQKTLRRLIHQVLNLPDAVYLDPIPQVIRQRQLLASLPDALREIHFPPDSTSLEDLEKRQTRAWKTLAFHRLMALQLGLAARRKTLAREAGRAVPPLHAQCSRLFKKLPPLTDDQRLALEDIKRDMMVPHPMARLLHSESRWRSLEVAAGTIALALEAGVQAVFIAPNELLVEQYAEVLGGLLKPAKIELELLTGSTRGKPRERLLGRIRKGEARFVLGTHVLLQDGVQFRNLGLVVLDEHRRLGMLQRRQLFRRGTIPDLLVLAADPMPKVILQSVYGDITWSTLKGMGKDAAQITSHMVVAENREECEVAIRTQLTQGRQLYYVSPESTEATLPPTQRLADLAGRLGQDVFPGTPVGWLHPRMPSAEQEDTLKRFRAGQLRVLVTSGEPDLRLQSSNASVMVIERADQLGLVETHAFRSTLSHSFYPATCYLVPSPAALPEDVELLRQLEKDYDGMALAEFELQSTGVPDALGIRQLNLTASLSTDLVLHGDLMDIARKEAFRWMDDSPEAEVPALNRPLLDFARMQWPQLFEVAPAA